MAEILIKAIDATHPDPVKDRRGCYKRGDIVAVMPDGHPWGKEEGLPKFVRIKIPGLAVSKIRRFVEPHLTAQTVTEVWPLEDYQKAVLSGDFGRFISQPVQTNSGATVIEGVTYYWVELQGQQMLPDRRRRWQALIDNIPTSVRQTLLSTGEITVTLTQIRNYLKDKVTGATY